jgi:hypothetical protein
MLDLAAFGDAAALAAGPTFVFGRFNVFVGGIRPDHFMVERQRQDATLR